MNQLSKNKALATNIAILFLASDGIASIGITDNIGR